MLRRLPYKYAVAVVTVLALFMDLLDLTIVNVAVPVLGEEFGAQPAQLQWAVTGYLLSLAVFLPASGWLSDRFGSKRTFVFALLVFTIASALCAAAWSLESLVAFRALQGVGGGLLVPVGMAVLFGAFPEEERSTASVIFSVPGAVAPALGPVLGGYLVTSFDWRWIFLINVPVGVLALLLAVLLLREHRVEGAGRFDLRGFVLGGAGLATLLYALSRAGEHALGSPEVLAFGAVGLVLLAAFVFVELRRRMPMIDVRLFRHRPFSAGNTVMFLAAIAFGGTLFLLPLLLQREQGLSAFESGFLVAPHAIGILIATPIAGRLYKKLGARPLLAAGMLGTAAATACFLLVGLDTPIFLVGALMFAAGIAFGVTIVPLQTVPFTGLGPDALGRASAVLNVVRQVGLAFGTALLATVLSAGLAGHGGAEGADPASVVGAYHVAFLVAAAAALVGFFVSLLLGDTAQATGQEANTSDAQGEDREQGTRE